MGPLQAGDPRKVGPYRLQERLGGGGMGQVFLGRSPGGRLVAVKLVRPELAANPQFRRRFALEVKAARQVGGFYTAQVVDADPNANPPWLVTAYIPGPSLHEAVERHGPLPAKAINVLGAGLAEGLAAIHTCNLVHRDLKPGNVILASDGPRVIDFGIARALDDTSHITSSSVLGTPGFMSPEQVRGDKVGPPSDVFSMGSVLAFAATGRSPFGTGRIEAVLYRIVHDDPDLAGLTGLLGGLVTACLAKEPDHRPSVADLLDHLATPAQTSTRWLPPDVTTMITERNATRPLTDAHRDTESTSDTSTPPGRTTAPPRQTQLTVENLSKVDQDVIVDDTVLGTIYAHGKCTFYIAPGTHDVYVTAGSRRSASQKIEARPGATVQLAFGAPTISFGAVTNGRLQMMGRAFTGWLSLLFVPVLGGAVGSVFTPQGTWVTFLQFMLVFGGGMALVVGVIGVAQSPDVVTVDREKLTVKRDDDPSLSIHWESLERIAVDGEGRKATLLVWFRRQPTPGWMAKHGIAQHRDGSYAIYGPARRFATNVYADRLRELLRVHAGTLYVDPDDVPGP